MIIRRLLRYYYRNAFDAEAGGGGTEAPAVEQAADAAPAAAAVESAPAESGKPSTMLEAMQRVWERDDHGRFAGGVKEVPAAPAPVAAQTAPADPAKAAAQSGQPAAPAAPKPEGEDLLTMPEGLGQKAQERFQKLATANRELAEKFQQAEQQVAYVRETFQSHGVRQDQFEQAVQVIGAMNRGDFAAAQKILSEQLRQVSLLTGQTVTGLDALAEFPDLRQSVDGFQMTEAAALELARMRKTQAAIQQRTQQQRAQQETQQREQQTFQKAQADVDAWTRSMAAQDIDWPAIEEQLLPDIGNLLKGVPPSSWVGVLQAQYSVLKRAAQRFKGSAAPAPAEPTPLRPVGASATQRAPQSMAEAMWGKSLSA